MISVPRAQTPEDLDALRDLVRIYVRWVMADVLKSDDRGVFAGLEVELADLPGRYGPPGGGLALARLNGAPADCVAFFDRRNATLQIKRMFVAPTARGHGIGRRMLDHLLTEGQGMGHRRALLWTHLSMHSAEPVYAGGGFRKVPFSQEFTGATDGVDVCMKRDLPSGALT
ncbi:WecD Histone acetyltransferase HPA2 and related acetyltransferases [Paracoccaceae bacterium]|jgi:GNAT superfamily N-acetyltransferase